MLQHAVDARGIEGIVGEGKRVGVAHPELGRQAERRRARGGLGDQRRARVDADGPARGRDQRRQSLDIASHAAADLDHRHARRQRQQIEALLLLRAEHPGHHVEINFCAGGVGIGIAPAAAAFGCCRVGHRRSPLAAKVSLQDGTAKCLIEA